MPRIRQNRERDLALEFNREIRSKQGYYNLMTQRSLANVTGIPQSTLSKRLANVDDFTVGELRKLITTVHPEPCVVLALLGYSTTELARAADKSK